MITYRIDQFEGPLDLLLSLISKNKINIHDIPISIICDQYMSFIEEAQIDMEISSEFLVMASQLMLIKSRMLLPKSGENSEEDPRAALASALIEYQRAKDAAKLFISMYSEFGGRIEKDTDEIDIDKTYIAEHDISQLTSALMRAYSDRDRFGDAKNISDDEKNLKTIISARTVSVTGKIFALMRLLRKIGKISAYEYFLSAEDKPSLISMFMGVLELLRAQRLIMHIAADEPDGTIPVNLIGKSIIFELDLTRKQGADTESGTIYEI